MAGENRTAQVVRQTRETEISAVLKLDGSGIVSIETGIGFFDHMLNAAMVHGFFDLELKARGDTHIDDHHTVEDTGIVLGRAFSEALGDHRGIRRFGHAFVPMDESLGRVCIDLSRRPLLVYEVPAPTEKCGAFDTELMEEFWRAFSIHSGANIHIDLLRGRNTHHIFEAVFKAAGRALDQACGIEPRVSGVVSTKGVL